MAVTRREALAALVAAGLVGASRPARSAPGPAAVPSGVATRITTPDGLTLSAMRYGDLFTPRSCS